jgi:hypothetical protein
MMGITPHSIGLPFRGTFRIMKTNLRRKPLTFGEFVTGVYDVCGKRNAVGIVRLAIKANLIEFLGQKSFIIS